MVQKVLDQKEHVLDGRKVRTTVVISLTVVLLVCLFVSYLFRVGHSTDMCSLLQENLLGGKKEGVSR